MSDSGTNRVTLVPDNLNLTTSQLQVGNMRWGEFKPLLADAVVAHLEPIQKKYHELMDDQVSDPASPRLRASRMGV